MSGRSFLAVVVFAIVTGLAAWLGRSWTAVDPQQLNDIAMEEVLQERLQQLYTAFAQTEEEAIYDGIAMAVAEPLIPALYLQQRATRLWEASDGGVTEVLEVRLHDWDRQKDGAVRVRWTVHARITHETHVHERWNTYAARLAMAPVSGSWRIVDVTLDDLVREVEMPEPEQAPSFFEDL